MLITLRLRTVMAYAAGLTVALVAVLVFRAWPAGAAGQTDSSFVPIVPCRLLDTRNGSNPTISTFQPGETRFVSIGWGNCQDQLPCVLAGCWAPSAIVLNVTAVGATQPTFITLWPHDKPQPLASNLNPAPGEPPTPNAVTVALGRVYSGGEGKIGFNVYNLAGTVDLIIDVVGYYTERYLSELTQRVSHVESDRPHAWNIDITANNIVVDFEVIAALHVTADQPGRFIVNTQTNVHEPDVGERVRCVVTDSRFGVQDYEFAQTWVSTGSDGTLSSSRGFSATTGEAVDYQLSCDSTNGAEITSATMTATFIPA